MKPILIASLALAIAACTPPDNADPAKVEPVAAPAPAEAPATTTPAVEAPRAVEAPSTQLRALAEAERAEKSISSRSCNLESIGGQAFADSDMPLSSPSAVNATGWLKADRDGVAIEDAAIRIESEDRSLVWGMPLVYGINRKDLSTASPSADAPFGFEAQLDANSLPSGRYHVYLAYRAEGVLYSCDNGRHISLL